MVENIATSTRALRRLASLKMDEDMTKPLLVRSSSEDYESIAKNGHKTKRAFVDTLRNVVRKWREKTAERREAALRAKRQRQLLREEQVMRHKLEYHFLTPFEKYKRGRKPWKLAIQILKIIIVTIQVCR